MIIGTDFYCLAEGLRRRFLPQAKEELAEIEADGIRHSVLAVHKQALDKRLQFRRLFLLSLGSVVFRRTAQVSLNIRCKMLFYLCVFTWFAISHMGCNTFIVNEDFHCRAGVY